MVQAKPSAAQTSKPTDGDDSSELSFEDPYEDEVEDEDEQDQQVRKAFGNMEVDEGNDDPDDDEGEEEGCCFVKVSILRSSHISIRSSQSGLETRYRYPRGAHSALSLLHSSCCLLAGFYFLLSSIEYLSLLR